MILRNDVDEMSSSVLDEIHLLVYLCSSIFPSVPKSELGSGSGGYGSVHAAILSLAARCVGTNQSHKVHAENPWTQGHGGPHLSIQYKEQMLRKALIMYLGAASEYTEPEITIVLSPIITTPRQQDRATRFIATVPTVGDAIEAWTDFCDELLETRKQMTAIIAELEARDHVQVEDIRQIASLQDVDTLGDLDIGQKRALICRELERTLGRTRNTANILLSSLEMVLLLLWRHIAYYCDSLHLNNPNMKVSTAAVLRSVPQPNDGSAFREDAAKRLSHVINQLIQLNLDYKWRESQAYIETMSRRIRDSIGLQAEDEEVNSITV